MNDLLTIIIIVLIIGIVLDGVRRARNNSTSKVKLSRNARKADQYFEAQQNKRTSSEFPSGGARPSIISRPKENLNTEPAAKSTARKIPTESPAQESLDFGESVPMLMDSIDHSVDDSVGVDDSAGNCIEENSESEQSALESNANVSEFSETWQDETNAEKYENDKYNAPSKNENNYSSEPLEQASEYIEQASDELQGAYEEAESGIDEYIDQSHLEPSIGQLDDLDSIEDFEETSYTVPPVNSKPKETEVKLSDRPFEGSTKSKEQKAEPHGRFHFGRSRKSENKLDDGLDSKPAEVPVEEILIINVMAKTGFMFDGVTLQNAFISEGLKFGQRQIFHRHKNNDGDAPILFSVANIMEPGYFNLTEMNSIETRGICVFLTLPAPVDAIQAYDEMANTAKALATMLDGVMKDENRSVMTRQNIEHGRQRVVEFERRRKLVSK